MAPETATTPQALLSLERVSIGYGRSSVVHHLDLEIAAGRRVALLGPNGAGKTTVLNAISGLAHVHEGRIRFAGESTAGMKTHRAVARGIVHVPQGRHVFPDFTVRENLRVAGYATDGSHVDEDVDRVLAAFPQLRERVNARAGFLSGGEQQMLAIGRAVVQRPRILLLDEVSLGLAPIVVKAVYQQLDSLFGDTAMLIVEQNPAVALKHAHWVYVLSGGVCRVSGPPEEFDSDDRLAHAYLGSSHHP